MQYSRLELPSLQDFCEEYNRLAELIVLFEKDTMEQYDDEEKILLEQVLLGRSRYSRQEIKMMYRVKRIQLMKKVIEENVALQKVQKQLSTYLKRHRIQKERLELAFKDQKLLTPTEIYVNYEHITRELERIKATLNAYNSVKK